MDSSERSDEISDYLEDHPDEGSVPILDADVSDAENVENNLFDDIDSNSAEDRYDQEGIDDQDYAQLTRDQYLAAARELDERDQRIDRIPANLLFVLGEDQAAQSRRRNATLMRNARLVSQRLARPESDFDTTLTTLSELEEPLDTESFKGVDLRGAHIDVGTFLDQNITKATIAYQFIKLLDSRSDFGAFCDDYMALGSRSFSLDWNRDFADMDSPGYPIARYIIERPAKVIPILNNVLTAQLHTHAPHLATTIASVPPKVRFTNYKTLDTIRGLKTNCLNTFVNVSGVVTRRSPTVQRRVSAKFICTNPACSAKLIDYVFDNFSQTTEEVDKGPTQCKSCSKRTMEIIADSTQFEPEQSIILQEHPSEVPAGRLPSHKEVILSGELCDSVQPGDAIFVTGEYCGRYSARINIQSSFPVFHSFIYANNITNDAEESFSRSAEDDVQILEIARQNGRGIRNLLIDSIAPSIYGNRFAKTALALSLFGGERKGGKSITIRGDINSLFIGDPSTAKSQLLKYAQKIAPKSVFTSGKGASAVGLTAAVKRDPLTHHWVLEGGAMVLADRGICLIDEFDKMNDQDRTSIHEALEQQTISISKAGIVATLNARCAVIAAANPVSGRYNANQPFSDNVNLSDPIVSRFDLICVIRDVIDPAIDAHLAKAVIHNHKSSHPFNRMIARVTQTNEEVSEQNLLSQEFLKKYIHYARNEIKNIKRSSKDDKKIKERIGAAFSNVKRICQQTGALHVTPRAIEAIDRIATASARMRLSREVNIDDVDFAISIYIRSIISCQKESIQSALTYRLRDFLMEEDTSPMLSQLLSMMMRGKIAMMDRHGDDIITAKIKREEFETNAKRKSFDKSDCNKFYASSFFASSYILTDTTIEQVI